MARFINITGKTTHGKFIVVTDEGVTWWSKEQIAAKIVEHEAIAAEHSAEAARMRSALENNE